jgi:hypothetical protein
MNTVITSPVSTAGVKDDAMAAYETLRRQAVGELGSHADLGMVLFLRQGMKAWMRARLQVTFTVTETSHQRGHSGGSIPLDLRGEAALILAGMALGGLQGGSR